MGPRVDGVIVHPQFGRFDHPDVGQDVFVGDRPLAGETLPVLVHDGFDVHHHVLDELFRVADGAEGAAPVGGAVHLCDWKKVSSFFVFFSFTLTLRSGGVDEVYRAGHSVDEAERRDAA
jgi:hypothetical protein